MNATVEDLRPTITPKSDQLNAEQLLSGPMTVTVTDVRVSDSGEQPVIVHYSGEDGRPYKPCKTMRKLLVHAWGENGLAWIGRSMTLYNDPDIKFGGEAVGGIRISHMTDIERDIRVSLTSTRGKKAKHEVRRMARPQVQATADTRMEPTAIADWLAHISGQPAVEELREALTKAYAQAKKHGDTDAYAAFRAAGLKRSKELETAVMSARAA